MTWTNKIRNILPGLLPPLLATYIKRALRASPYKPERVVTASAAHPQGAAIFKEAYAHLENADKLGRVIHGIPASPRWAMFLNRMRDDISRFTSCEETIIFSQTKIDFDHRQPIADCAHLFQLHGETLKNEFPQYANLLDEMGDSKFSRPETMLARGQQLVSNIFFHHMSHLLQCLTWVPKTELVCEIGGGYGAPARLWLMNPVKKVKTYVIIDFPESLFFAEVYLRSNFDDLKLHYVTDGTPLTPEFVGKHRVVLCPIHHVAALTALDFDLIINTGSMQEMPEEWLDYWSGWLKRQNCRFFFSLNYFAQPLNFLAESGNVWSPRPTAEWTVRLQRFDPAFVMQQTTRHYAEMIYEKTGPSPLAAPEALASRYQVLRELDLDGQTMLESMNIVRIGGGEKIMFDLLQRMMQLPTTPKEASYLAETLLKTGSEEFLKVNGNKVNEIAVELRKIRARGRENTHSN